MSGIRCKNTQPEMLVRRSLHAMGLRYRLHDRRLPGKPDLVFPKYRTIIEVRGCFWHAHGCRDFKMPNDNMEFWKEKLEANVARDERNLEQLLEAGWGVGIVWECYVRQHQKGSQGDLSRELFPFIKDWSEPKDNVVREFAAEYL